MTEREEPRGSRAPERFYLAKACPDCGGKGWRITTQDGARPPCLTCGGAGRVPDVPAPLGDLSDAAWFGIDYAPGGGDE